MKLYKDYNNLWYFNSKTMPAGSCQIEWVNGSDNPRIIITPVNQVSPVYYDGDCTKLQKEDKSLYESVQDFKESCNGFFIKSSASGGSTSGVSSVAGKSGDVALTKNDVGLSNVNNTSDLDKPISTETQRILNETVAQVETDLNVINTMYPSFSSAKRIIADSGIIRSKANFNELTGKFVDLLPNTKFLYCPQLAVKLRTSGITNYITKLYDIGSAMIDATQTTALNQPYLSGNIAPNEKYALKNPNGGIAYMTHTPISFLANDKWSVSFSINNYGFLYGAYLFGNRALGHGLIIGNTNNVGTNYGRFLFANSIGTYPIGAVGNNLKNTGKSSILTLVSNGNSIRFYVNSTIFGEINNIGDITFNSIISSVTTGNHFNGSMHYYAIRNIALTPTQVAEEYTYLRTIFPEIESVQIGTQTWTTSNCEMTCTPQGNVIQEMQAATNVERVVNGGFDAATNWGNGAGVTISSGNLIFTDTNNNVGTNQGNVCKPNTWYKYSINIKTLTTGGIKINVGGYTSIVFVGGGVKTGYVLSQSNSATSFYIQANGVTTAEIDDVSLQEVGWSDSTNLYNYIYANTTGTAEQKEYAAVEAAAMWRNVNNDPTLASIYGKKFNKYAKRLLAMDIAYYNAANPTALWGWDIPTRAQLTTLAANGGNALKVAGSNYWNTANGNNATGFSLLGGGYVDSNGVYVNNKAAEGVWCKDADFARIALDADNTFNEVAATTEGHSIRLIKV